MKPVKVFVVLLSSVLLAGLFTGCAWSIGGSDSKAHTVSPPTKGQELIDLKRAKDQGAITESEYATKKEQILAK